MSREMIPQYDTKLFTEIWDTAGEFLEDYQTVGIPTTISTANATTLFYLLFAKYGNNPIANYDEEQFKYKIFSIVFQYGPTWEKRLSVQNTLRGLQLSDLIDDGAFSEAFSETGSNSSTTSGTSGNTRTLNTQEANTGTQGVTHTGTATTASTGTSALAHAGTVGVLHDNDIQNSGNDTTIDNHAYNPGTAPAQNAYDPLTYINEQNAQKVTKGTKSEQDESSTTTYNNTDTTTNNLQNQTTNNLTDTTTNNLTKADTGTITDSGTNSSQVSGQDSRTNSTTRTLTKGKLAAYEKLLELLDADVTGDFINKFKVCFKQFVMPEKTWIYVTELDDEEDDE